MSTVASTSPAGLVAVSARPGWPRRDERVRSDWRRAWDAYVGAADRVGPARRAVAVFDLDPELLAFGPAPDWPSTADRVPRDPRLSAVATAAALDVELPSLDTMLLRLRAELEESAPARPVCNHEEVRT